MTKAKSSHSTYYFVLLVNISVSTMVMNPIKNKLPKSLKLSFNLGQQSLSELKVDID